MFKTKLLTAAVAASIAFAPVAEAAFIPPPVMVTPHAGPAAGAYALPICVISIILAAADKGQRWHRELTTEEAITCGLLYWVNAGNRPR